jgi:hypothetical protein
MCPEAAARCAPDVVLHDGQGDGEGGAAPLARVHRDVAVVRVHQLLHDVEPQPRAPVLARRAHVHLR